MSEEKKNEVAVFEQIRRDLSTQKDAYKVPMSMVFGRGTVGDISSFGNRTLSQNAEMIESAIDSATELQNIWNRGHTQWTWKHINLNNISTWDNIRQVSAELANKKTALNEAKWRHVEAELKMRKLEDELQKGNESGKLDYWREVEIKVKLAKYKEQMAEGMTYIEGAMKDCMVLDKLYGELKERISNFNEADYEKEESKNHLRRALLQSLRDVRMTGAITKGEQELMEQIGVNPTKLQKLLRAYIASEETQETWGVDGLYEFVYKLADELIDEHKIDQLKMQLQGFSQNPWEEFTYLNRIGQKSQEKD
jgi:hypothetical protein